MQEGLLLKAGEVVVSPKTSNIESENFLQIKACGVCATDRKAFLNPPASMDLPRVLGHEISGTLLVDLGTLSKGTDVVLWPAFVCNSCEYCLSRRPQLCSKIRLFGLHVDGGFSDTLSLFPSVPQDQIIALPHTPAISHQQAVFAEPLGCVLHGLAKAQTVPSEIMVYGAGLMGNLATQAASSFWPEAKIMLYDNDPQCQSSLLVNHLIVLEPKSADLIFVACSSKEAVCSALDLLKPGGTLVLFSGLTQEENLIEINHNRLHRKEQVLIGSYGCTPEDMAQALELMADNKVKVKELVTKTLPLSQLGDELARNTTHQDYKTIIIPEP